MTSKSSADFRASLLHFSSALREHLLSSLEFLAASSRSICRLFLTLGKESMYQKRFNVPESPLVIYDKSSRCAQLQESLKQKRWWWLTSKPSSIVQLTKNSTPSLLQIPLITLSLWPLFFIFYKKKAFQKLWKMLFISSKKLFLLSRYSIFRNFFPSFSHFPNSKGQTKLK